MSSKPLVVLFHMCQRLGAMDPHWFSSSSWFTMIYKPVNTKAGARAAQHRWFRVCNAASMYQSSSTLHLALFVQKPSLGASLEHHRLPCTRRSFRLHVHDVCFNPISLRAIAHPDHKLVCVKVFYQNDLKCWFIPKFRDCRVVHYTELHSIQVQVAIPLEVFWLPPQVAVELQKSLWWGDSNTMVCLLRGCVAWQVLHCFGIQLAALQPRLSCGTCVPKFMVKHWPCKWLMGIPIRRPAGVFCGFCFVLV